MSVPDPRPPGVRRALRIVGVGGSALLVGAALALVLEAGFTFLGPCRLSGIVYDEALGWRLQPGRVSEVRHPWATEPVALRFNRGGFRDLDHAVAKPDDVTRMLLLGDSYTVGLEVPFEQTFAARLRRGLAASTDGARLEVLSAAVGAWATDQQLLYLRDEGLAYAPDRVVLVVAPNDVREAYGKGFFRLVDGALRQEGPEPIPAHARLAWGLSNRSCAFQALQSLLGTGHGAPSGIFRLFPLTFPVGSTVADDRHLFAVEPPPEIREALALFDALVLEADALCRRAGCELVLTIVPTKIELDGTLDPGRERGGRIAEHLGALAAGHGIPFLDLYARLAESDVDPLELFIAEEYHFTERGHAFVADELLAFLTGLPPRR